ncbi:MAG: hypothetical protein Kow009_08660 [Spirochaetales bacterium]
MSPRKLFLQSLLGIFILSLSSCIDLETRIDLAQDGSGTLDLVYIVSSALVQLGSTASPGVSLPLPVEEQDLRDTVASVPGLTLRSYERTDEPEKRIIKASLAFSSLSDVNALFGGNETVISQRQNGNDRVMEILIDPGKPGGLDPKTKEVAEAFFSNYSLKFHITLPQKVKRTNLEQSVVDGNTVQLTVPIVQVLEQETPLKWEIYW